MFEANKVDNKYNETYKIIINNKKKLKDIIFNKYVISNDVFIIKIAYKYLSLYIRLIYI